MLLREQDVLPSNPSASTVIVVVGLNICGIIELSLEIDIFREEDEVPPDEDELEDKPPEDDELEDTPPEDEELFEKDDVLPELDDWLFEKDEELPELDEEELLDEDVTQSVKPKQVVGFVGQQPFVQQSSPHCVYRQPSPGSAH